MALKTDIQLNTQAEEVRDETVALANTALRVGTLFEDMNDSKLNRIATDPYSVAVADTSGEIIFGWILYDNIGNESIDINTRVLKRSDGSTAFDWENDSLGDYLPLAGGSMDTSAEIRWAENNAGIGVGLTNQATGGYKGVSLYCAVDYELNWQAGDLTSYESGGTGVVRPLYLQSDLSFKSGTQIVDSTLTPSANTESRVLVNAGGTTLDWDNTQMYDSSARVSVDWGRRKLNHGASTFLDWSVQTTYDTLGVNSIDWGERLLLDAGAYYSLDWGNRRLHDSAEGYSIDYGNRITYDFAQDPSINWDLRTLERTAGSALDWQNGRLADTSSVLSLDWDNRKLSTPDVLIGGMPDFYSLDWQQTQLNNAFGLSLDWSSAIAYDSSGLASISWGSRSLHDNAGNDVLNYSMPDRPILYGDLLFLQGNNSGLGSPLITNAPVSTGSYYGVSGSRLCATPDHWIKIQLPNTFGGVHYIPAYKP